MGELMSKQSLKVFLEDNSKKSRLIDLVLKNYSVIDKDVDISLVEGAQLFEGCWMIPVWGCDTLQKLIDDIEWILNEEHHR